MLSEEEKIGEETIVAVDSSLHWWGTQCVQCAGRGPRRGYESVCLVGIQDVCDWMTGMMGPAEKGTVLFMLARTT